MTNKTNNNELSIFIQQLKQLDKQPLLVPGIGEVTPAEFHLLAEVGDADKLTSKDLSLRLRITKGGISQIVNPLVERGLLVKAVNPLDRRLVYLQLSEAGQTVFVAHQDIQQGVQTKLEQALTPAEIQIFQRGLAALNEYTEGLISTGKEEKLNK